MVSTRSPKSTGVLTRKKSAAELIKGRPKRNVSPKNLVRNEPKYEDFP